ncbi:hypothetical protein BC835DRAFT_1530912 [Cytidiella melzeri]|nr:hypothetical protein BC835DRAFT_1530912 [Cytidiella melzeri]
MDPLLGRFKMPRHNPLPPAQEDLEPGDNEVHPGELPDFEDLSDDEETTDLPSQTGPHGRTDSIRMFLSRQSSEQIAQRQERRESATARGRRRWRTRRPRRKRPDVRPSRKITFPAIKFSLWTVTECDQNYYIWQEPWRLPPGAQRPVYVERLGTRLPRGCDRSVQRGESVEFGCCRGDMRRVGLVKVRAMSASAAALSLGRARSPSEEVGKHR